MEIHEATDHRAGENRLRSWIETHRIDAEQIVFDTSCHSVAEAADATGAGIDAIIKNICMIDGHGHLIVAIVPGAERASTRRVGHALGTDRPRIATPEEVLTHSGYPAGGTPSFGFAATFIVDPQVMERAVVYTGGGSDRALVRITPDELVRASGALVARVRK